MFKPRPNQQDILRYQGGRMAVSAVPGSGKTTTLSAMAAQLIEKNQVEDDQEVLIVTLVNSAVDNFASRIRTFMEAKNLPNDFGYRVRTLHGLAHDIVRERPDLAGLPNQFVIADERDAEDILKNTAQAWLQTHQDVMVKLTSADIDLSRNTRARQEWGNLVTTLSKNFIRSAKDLQTSPAELRSRLGKFSGELPLVEMGIEVYAAYQQALNYRSALDFDDLIRLALQALKADGDFLLRLRRRWPYILEDEAQDSSRLQQDILSLLAGGEGNWVRVGDPNQAIYETFTTANPEYFIEFKNTNGVANKPLRESGRSTRSIMTLANELARWTEQEHPNPELRKSLAFTPIFPTSTGDTQSNPADRPEGVILYNKTQEPAEEIRLVVNSIRHWLPEHPKETLAVLVPRNKRGTEIAEELKKYKIEPVELLQSSLNTRKSARLVAAILESLCDPTSAAKLTLAFRELYQQAELDPAILSASSDLLRKCQRIEEFLWPFPGRDWLKDQAVSGISTSFFQQLGSFRELICRWQKSTRLPIDQLVLTVAQDIFGDQPDLALAHQLALALEQASRIHPDWHLPEFTEELQQIARNERKFQGVNEGNDFDPEQHKGKVVIATIHKAKGLEWDRVYLISANNYDFPSGESGDQYISERWFVNGHLNLEAETLARLKALAKGDLPGLMMEEGSATLEARLEYSRERLRLFYVGITRARRDLIITWNTGQRNNCKPSLAFEHLSKYWEDEKHDLAV
jgi:DNA helicase-2/ATP-dependent DNA helicase PcrA